MRKVRHENKLSVEELRTRLKMRSVRDGLQEIRLQ